MHNFEYAAPRSVAEVMRLIGDRARSPRMLAGGTDLIVMMRAGQKTPGLLIDAKHVPELNALELDDAGLTIGAAVSCRQVYEHARIAARYPALIDSTQLIGGIQIQGRASIGGNLCNAAPSADTVPTLIVLGAVARIRGPGGDREMAVERFCTGPGRTVLAEDEILLSLRIPAPVPRSGARFLRFIPRNEMDIAVVNVAAAVVLNAAGDRFESARIALGAVAPTPLLVEAAGQALAGKAVSEESINAAAAIARDAARPINDMRGTIEHRRHLCGVLTVRALRGAVERARGGVI
jgi:carbon-monoxide dehydrogenase medium subunit